MTMQETIESLKGSERILDDAVKLLSNIRETFREKLREAYIADSGKQHHASDCATSPMRLVPGPCDCHES